MILDVTPREKMMMQAFMDFVSKRLAERDQQVTPFVEAVNRMTAAITSSSTRQSESIAALSLEEKPAPQVTNQVDVTPIAAAVAAGIADMTAKMEACMSVATESSRNLERILGELRDALAKPERKMPTAWKLKTDKDGTKSITAVTK
jgi:hypothetical protein